MRPEDAMNAPIRTSGTAIASLIFGLICWVMLPFVGAVVAVICGHIARGEIRRMPPGTIDGDGMAIAGLVLGYVHLAICLLFVLLIGLIIYGVGGWH